MLPVKQVINKLLDKLVRNYPKPPTSGISASITVYSSREWYEWWNNLSRKQRNQLVRDAFKQPRP